MLPKLNRIKKKNDFKLIFEKAKSFKSRILILRAMPNGLKENRFAFIVSLKVSKKAAVRNKIRRRLSSIVQKHMSGITCPACVDAVFIALPGIEKKDFAEIKKAVDSLLCSIQ